MFHEMEIMDHFYDNPRLPGAEVMEEIGSLRIDPFDAQSIILNSINDGRELSADEIEALHRIQLNGLEVDFVSILRDVKRERGDWDD